MKIKPAPVVCKIKVESGFIYSKGSIHNPETGSDESAVLVYSPKGVVALSFDGETAFDPDSGNGESLSDLLAFGSEVFGIECSPIGDDAYAFGVAA